MTPPPPTRHWLLPPLSKAAPAPLYQQIVEGFRREILAGRLQPEESLPSFRALAEELLVSLITVKRAYEDLEREGLIYSRQGLGTFVAAGGAERTRRLQREETERQLRAALQAGKDAGMTDRELIAIFKSILSEEKSHV